MCDRCAISSRDSAVSRSWLISRRQQWSRWVYRHIFSSSVPAVGHTCLLYIYRGHCVEDVFSNCDIACCVFTAWCNFARCMSVCLSHASGMSKRLNIVTLFFQSLCHITLVLAVANVVAILHHHPPPITGCWMQVGYEKVTIFDNYLATSQKPLNIRPDLLWKGNEKLHPSFRVVSFSMTLSDPWPIANKLKSVRDRVILTMADQ